MKTNIRTILIWVALMAVVIFIVGSSLGSAGKDKPVYSEILQLFKDDKVKSFEISNSNYLKLVTVSDEKYSIRLRDLYLFREDVGAYLENPSLEFYDLEEPKSTWLVTFLPYAILIVVVVGIWIFMMNRADGGISKMNAFGKAKVKFAQKDKNTVYFSDVAGADEEKDELREIVDYLKAPDKYRKLGARIPRGVLLIGPPGTGKTLLAKAVAGEAGVPFFSISGSDFVEMYVGVGASRVRDLFETAKKAPASIVFIDEIDAVGRHRGAGLGGGHDEREQTLNQLLVEMDGFVVHDGIIVMAATNRPDILDPALLRPGRFDRQVTVGYPDIKGREEILFVHARNKPFEKEVDFHDIARTTVGFTGADLANLLNESALVAARKNKALIGRADIDEAMLKLIVGTQKKSKKINDSDKRNTAYHEAGHAILAHLLPTQDPVKQISIIPAGMALGYTLNFPEEDKYSEYKQEMKERISVMLGGRAAEEIIFSDVSGGASNDIKRATAIAHKMVTVYGMSEELGTVCLDTSHGADEVFLGRDFSANRDYSESTAAKIDAEIKKLVGDAYEKAKELLNANRDKLDFIASFLIKNETMDEEQFKAAMDTDATTEELEKLSEKRRQKSEEENALREKADSEARRREAEEAKRRDEEARRRGELPY